MYSCTGTPTASAARRRNCFLNRPSVSAKSAGVSGASNSLVAPSSTYSMRVGRPVLVGFGIAVERKPPAQVAGAARIVHEQRAYAALHRHPAVTAADGVRDAVLRLTRRVDVEHRRRVVVVQVLHDVLQEVPLHRGAGLDHEHVRVERGDEAQFLAIFLLAADARRRTGRDRSPGRSGWRSMPARRCSSTRRC